jgi:hypothetical protein
MRRLRTAGVVLSSAFALASVNSVTAVAAPDEASCAFALSAPSRVQLGSDAELVTATLSPQRCEGKSQPIRSTVCISSPTSRTECHDADGWDTARAFIGPYVAGESFTATGSGCYIHGKVAESICIASGPTTVRL